MKCAVTFAAMILWSGLAIAQESAISNETTTADETADKAETVAAANAKKEEEFVPPPGYKSKKRGKITLYCIQDSTVGTRFKTEKCYDEDQMRALILDREQNNRDFDRARATCSNPAICAPP